MGQVDAHNGKGVPAEGFNLWQVKSNSGQSAQFYDLRQADLLYQEEKGEISLLEEKFTSLKSERRVPKESMAWFPGPKWNEFVLKCKLNVPNSKKRKVVGQAKSRQARSAYLAEGLSQLNAWTWLEQRENVCNFLSCFSFHWTQNKSPENQPQKSLPNDFKLPSCCVCIAN